MTKELPTFRQLMTSINMAVSRIQRYIWNILNPSIINFLANGDNSTWPISKTENFCKRDEIDFTEFKKNKSW